MPVTTVSGQINRDELGFILPHEHIFINLLNQFTEPPDPAKRQRSTEPISLANYGALRRNPYALRDNLVIDDLEGQIAEIKAFKEAGGGTIVDCTSVGVRREPLKLREAASRTGVRIVVGGGYYTYDTHPADMDGRTVEELAAEMVRDLTEGIDGTGVRAGVIGEIGTSDPMRPNERKSLQAAALAYRQTGVPLQIHTYPWGSNGLECVRILNAGGVPPERVVICHVDVEIKLDYIRALLRAGVYVEFDNFGKEFYIDSVDRIGFSGGVFERDLDRVRALKTLAAEGFEDRLLVTNDICLKQMLLRYGGWGYGHILNHIAPMMADVQMPADSITRILYSNPADWLCPE